MDEKYGVGNWILFPHTGSRYVITAVDLENQTVTFAHPAFTDDQTTETIADLESVDVRTW